MIHPYSFLPPHLHPLPLPLRLLPLSLISLSLSPRSLRVRQDADEELVDDIKHPLWVLGAVEPLGGIPTRVPQNGVTSRVLLHVVRHIIDPPLTRILHGMKDG